MNNSLIALTKDQVDDIVQERHYTFTLYLKNQEDAKLQDAVYDKLKCMYCGNVTLDQTMCGSCNTTTCTRCAKKYVVCKVKEC